jgi:hypothetical protein
MKARVLIESASLGPDDLKTACQAFDNAWAKIAARYKSAHATEAARMTELGIPFVVYTGYDQVHEACRAGVIVRKPADNLPGEVKGRNVDRAFLATLDHAEAVVLIPDVATYQRWLEPHHRVPAHRHDIRLAFPGRAYEHNRAWFQKPAYLRYGEVSLREGYHRTLSGSAGGHATLGPHDLALSLPPEAAERIEGTQLFRGGVKRSAARSRVTIATRHCQL